MKLSEFIKPFNLSTREIELLPYIATTSLKNREIGAIIFRSVTCIKSHATNIYRKTGVIRRAQLMLLCARYEMDLPTPGFKRES